jgi:elongation factor G
MEVLMKDIKQIRNIAIVGRSKGGKTTFAESLLFTTEKTTRQGKVDDGSSVLDFEPEEINRNLTINSSFHQYNWKKHSVYFIDTPGDQNFINDAKYATEVTDAAIIVINAEVGVKYQTERITSFVENNKLPTFFMINKMDKERADLDNCINGINEQLPLKPAICFLPIGKEENFKGAVNLLTNKAYLFDEKGSGKVTQTDIPDDLADDVSTYRESLMEQVAETDDELIESFLEEGELTEKQLQEGLSKAVRAGEICPVCIGSALQNKGTELILNMINEFFPSPDIRPARTGTNDSDEIIERKAVMDEPFSALVFKTMADPFAGKLTIFKVMSGTLSGDHFYNVKKETNEKFGQLLLLEGKSQKPVDEVGPGMIAAVAKLKKTVTGDTLSDEKHPIIFESPKPIPPSISFAVTTKKMEDEDKLYASITKMLEEDPTLNLTREKQTNETLISGVGQVHMTVVGEKIKRKFGVEMSLKLPKIPYKETLKGKIRIQGKHKKQSGGRGQYGDSWLEIESLPGGSGFVFENKIVGGVIPRQYIPAVERGVIEAMTQGVIAGYPMVDIKVSLVDGSFHAVDSSEMAFKISGSIGFKKGAPQADPVLLEPIMDMSIEIPEDCVGDVIGDLNSRRGKVMGMDSKAKVEVITAKIPMSEIQEYAPDLTSITGGRGCFFVTFSHYEELPAALTEKVVEKCKEENA